MVRLFTFKHLSIGFTCCLLQLLSCRSNLIKPPPVSGDTKQGSDRGAVASVPSSTASSTTQQTLPQGGNSSFPKSPSSRILSNPFFQNNSTLQNVLEGKLVLHSGKGDHVKLIQRALKNLTFDLPFRGIDSKFGQETRDVLSQFQNLNGIEQTKSLNAKTMAILDRLTPQTPRDALPEYAKIFGDRLFYVTVSVGFSDLNEIKNNVKKDTDKSPSLITRIKSTGFQLLNRQSSERIPLSALALYKKHGLPPPVFGSGDYYFKPQAFTYNGKSIDCIIRIIFDIGRTGRDAFLEALAKSDTTIYVGHGRLGSGPDFDSQISPEGNIWISDAPGAVNTGQTVKHLKYNSGFEKNYKLWVFVGCQTSNYILPIRRLRISSKQTDIFAWQSKVNIEKSSPTTWSMINSLIHRDTLRKIIRSINAINEESGHAGLHGDGFADNPGA